MSTVIFTVLFEIPSKMFEVIDLSCEIKWIEKFF